MTLFQRLHTYERLLRPPVRTVGICALAAMVSSCNLFGLPANGPTFDKKAALPPLRVAPEAIQLDIVYVERLINDPLWTEDLWNSVDQISNLPVDQRAQIDKDGLFVGVVGCNPPPSLQRLLELQTEMPDLATSSRERNVKGLNVFRMSGESTIIQASPIVPELDISHILPEYKEKLTQAQAILDVKVERLQDGWIKLQVTPEIHYGQHQMRPAAGENGFEMKSSRQVITLADRRFTMSLNVGEMMVVSSDRSHDAPCLGKVLFEADSHLGPVQRLIVVRLNDMKKVKPMYRESL